MDFKEIINTRRSTRAYTDKSVSREIIDRILEYALYAPSGMNLQPWGIYVISGEEKDRLGRVLLKSYKEKQISCSPKTDKPLPDKYGNRSSEFPIYLEPLLQNLGLSFHKFINEGSCNFYGAPVAVIMCIDDIFPPDRLVDIGIITAYILLGAHESGLGTCPIGLVAEYQDEIKELLNIPENRKIVLGIALGYADKDNPVNAYRSRREEFDRIVKWID